MQKVQANQIQAKDSSSLGAMKRREKELINKNPRMVGRKDEVDKLLDLLIEGQSQLSVISIFGISGLGKSTFAAEAYNNNYVKNYFDCRAWIVVPFNYNSNKILKALMPSYWSGEIILKALMPSYWLGETSCSEKTPFAPGAIRFIQGFGALLLKKDKQAVVSKLVCYFHETNRLLSRLRFPYRIPLYFYLHVPFHLKSCFLNFAVFPECFEISTRQLYQLWIAERFIQDNSEARAEEYLEEIVDRGFLQVTSRTSVGRIKTCCIHSFLRFISAHEAGVNELRGFGRHKQDTSTGLSIDSHPHKQDTSTRLSIDSDPAKFVSSRDSAPYVRSLLCLTSERDHLATIECNYLSENFKILSVLNLGSLIVKEYPVGIESLILLRYLKLNMPSLISIPSSLCHLLNLYTLDMPSSHIDHTPDDIWKMHKLRHLNLFIEMENILTQFG